MPWLLRCLVMSILLLVLMHLYFIDNAVFVFAKLTSLVRCMIVKVSQCFPWRFLVVLADAFTFHNPPILHMWLRRLLVHHTAIAHHAIICHRGIILHLVCRRVVPYTSATVMEKSLGVWQRGGWLLLVLNEPTLVLVCSATS